MIKNSKIISYFVVSLLLLTSVISLAANDAEKEVSAKVKKEIIEKKREIGKELDKILLEIKSNRKKIERLKQRVATEQGERKKIMEARLDKAWINLLKLGLDFGNIVTEKDLEPAIRDKFKNQAINVLEPQAYIAHTIIARIDKRIDIPGENLSASKQAVIYSGIFNLVNLLTETHNLLLESLVVSKKLGVDVSQHEEKLKESLENRAANISIFLESAQIELVGINAGLSAVSDDAELKIKQTLLDARINKLAEIFADVLNMMDTFKMDTSTYRHQILSATGEITAKVAAVGVMTTIFLNWSNNITKEITDEGPNVIFKILLFIFIIYIFRKLSQLIQRVMKRAFRRSTEKSSELLRNMSISITKNIVFLLGILLALSQIGISLGPVLAGLGVAGFVIGFALQDSLANFAAGMMILVYRPFDVGDQVDTCGVFGKVHHMSLVNTTIMTFDNQTIIVPNTKIWGDVIKNVTAQKIRRVDMTFRISYSDDIEKTERVLADIVAQHDKTLTDPEPLIRLHELGESSVNFIVKPWVNCDDYWGVYWDITRSVKMRFDEEGISIPFPQRDVYTRTATE